MNFLEFIFTLLLTAIFFLINLILIPIDVLISGLLPDLSDAFVAIADYIEQIITNIGWVISITGIPPFAIGLVVAYWIFKLTVPIQVWFIKLAIAWYHKLKP